MGKYFDDGYKELRYCCATHKPRYIYLLLKTPFTVCQFSPVVSDIDKKHLLLLWDIPAARLQLAGEQAEGNSSRQSGD